MAIKYISYDPQPLQGQAVLNCFRRTRRMLRYQGDNELEAHIERGMPLYEVSRTEPVNGGSSESLLFRGECISVCAYLKEKGIKADLVYIDPPFDSEANYSKKVYLRKNPKVAEAIFDAEKTMPDFEELRTFEEKMYGDKWEKERYLDWMYQNLLAIKSVMSEQASIYVHLDWHIGHYVKILMDEIFGEANFMNEIVWHYYNKMQGNVNRFASNHDAIFVYKMSDSYCFQPIKEKREEKTKQIKRVWDKTTQRLVNAKDENGKVIYIETDEKTIDDVWRMSMLQPADTKEPVDYSTQKPEALLERVINASSNEGMLVADFFSGSGTTAAVAHKLNRRFIAGDIGINSIETTRDRLKNLGANFDVVEIKDGVTLYRNPVQTKENISKVIKGLSHDVLLPSIWFGCLHDSKDGIVPVYVPDFADSTTRILTKELISRIIHTGMPELPDGVKRVTVYYIDVENLQEIQQFIETENYHLIKIDLHDLKPKLDNFIMADDARWKLTEVKEGMFDVWQVSIDSYFCDRVIKKIEEYNLKTQEQWQNATDDERKRKPLNLIKISPEGLETIEWLSLDCTSAEGQDEWHSDVELKIETDSHVRYNNGEKSQNYWDGTIRTLDDRKPLRLKIRNICGDETIFSLSKEEYRSDLSQSKV